MNCPSLTAAQGRGRGTGERSCGDRILCMDVCSPDPFFPTHEDAAELRVKWSSYQSNNVESTHLLRELIAFSNWSTVSHQMLTCHLPCSRKPVGFGGIPESSKASSVMPSHHCLPPDSILSFCFFLLTIKWCSLIWSGFTGWGPHPPYGAWGIHSSKDPVEFPESGP